MTHRGKCCKYFRWDIFFVTTLLNEQNSTHMIGIVEDRADPQQRGRLRVRWFGYYSDEIAREDLPWCIVVSPVTSAGMSGVGQSPTGAMEGTFVIGSFIDDSQQQAVVFGSINPVEGSGNGLMNQDGILDQNERYDGPSTVNFEGDGPSWFNVATGEIGVKEYRNGSNPRVIEYAKTNGFSDDQTPWCASFVKWCLKQASVSTDGITGMARSASRASSMEKLDKPLYGCIAVLSRPPNPSSGHIAFLQGIQGGRLKLLGGNQSNAVTISGYPSGRLIGFYWPKGSSKEGFEIS